MEPKFEPHALYVEGSYFGDHDVLVDGQLDGRDSTAVAWTDATLLVLTKAIILKLFKQFPKVKKQMESLAQDKRQSFQNSIKKSQEEFL